MHNELSGTFGEQRWIVLEKINGVVSGMFLNFDDYSRAVLALINYRLTPNYSHYKSRHVFVSLPG